MHKNVSLGFNGVDRVRSLRKIPTRLRGTNFCSNSARFAPSFVSKQTVPNAPKWDEMHHNVSLGSNGVDRMCSLQKIPTRLHDTNFCKKDLPVFHSVSEGNQMIPNALK